MIGIVFAKHVTEEPWICWLEITQGGVTWMLPAVAPSLLSEGELQAYFEGIEDPLWTLAERNQYPPKLCGNVETTALVRPLMLALLDEINWLREEQGHGPLNEGDIVDGIKSHLVSE